MDDYTFGVKEGGGIDVVVEGEVHEAPVSDGPPLMEELPPVEAAPEDPVIERLREKAASFDAFEPLLRRLGRGEVVFQEASPPEPVPPAPEEMAGYFSRLHTPYGPAIHQQIVAYADMLPPDQKAALENVPSRYNETFDKFLNANRPAQRQEGPGRDVIEKVLAAKETRKDAARVESSGIMRGNRASFEERPTGREAEIARLKKAIRMNPNDQDLATALASHYIDGL
jgi:hypothetical protein